MPIVNEIFFSPSTFLVFAVLADLMIGDPQWLYHPVQGIGFLIETFEPRFRRRIRNKKWAGIVFALFIIFLCTVSALSLLLLAYRIHFFVGLAVHVLGIASALSVKSLAREGWVVRRLLQKQDIEGARKRVSLIVSRDLSHEDKQGILRALIETMTENLSDGVIAPLFFAIFGGMPGIWFYKTVNTLDSMIGYKNQRYKDFGWFAAKLDDVVNYIPARMTGILIVMTSVLFFKKTKQALWAWYRDAQKGPSPNGGIPIVVFAGAQDISLGGNCFDQSGNLIEIPHVGGQRKELHISDLHWTLIFHYTCIFLFLLFIIVLM
ncbi:cobalamin biosynthesis protein CobD [Candidatus Uhrbacteria bacterium]|nr:cobalamin biosynthesis protein CobD [Candidatus Uhrbacteria bacterium]